MLLGSVAGLQNPQHALAALCLAKTKGWRHPGLALLGLQVLARCLIPVINSRDLYHLWKHSAQRASHVSLTQGSNSHQEKHSQQVKARIHIINNIIITSFPVFRTRYDKQHSKGDASVYLRVTVRWPPAPT